MGTFKVQDAFGSSAITFGPTEPEQPAKLAGCPEARLDAYADRLRGRRVARPDSNLQRGSVLRRRTMRRIRGSDVVAPGEIRE